MRHCLKTADGSVVWKIDTFKEYGVIQNFFGVGAAPVIEGELIIAQVGGSPKGSEEVDFYKLKGNGSGVIAWDKKTGKEKWRLSNDLASYSSPRMARSSLLLVDGHVIFMGEYGDLRLLKVNPKKYEEVSQMVVFPPGKDGKPDRDADPLLTYPCWAAPILSHGLLYLRGKEHLV